MIQKNTIVVRGRKIEYGVSDKGIFGASWQGENYEHPTLAGLKAALDRQMEHKPMSVPIVKIENDHYYEGYEIRFVKGTVVGIHSGNSNLLVKWDGKESVEQDRDWRDHKVKGNTDLKKLRALYDKAVAASRAYEEFRDAHAFDRASLKEGEES